MADVLTRIDLAAPGVTVLEDWTANSPGSWKITPEAARKYWSEDAELYAIPIVGEPKKRRIEAHDIGKAQVGMWPTRQLPDGYTWAMGTSPFGQAPDYAFLDRAKIQGDEQRRLSAQLDAIEAKLDAIAKKVGA